jgi:hypothetical protein
MEFSPGNPIVQLCLQAVGMKKKCMEQEGQKQAADKLSWLEAALQAALEIHDGSVKSALASLYSGPR